MRPLPSALSIALGFLLLAGCSAGNTSPPAPADQPVSVIPPWIHPFAMPSLPLRPFVFNESPTSGIYAAEFTGRDLLGYSNPNRHNAKALCKIASSSVNGFSLDGQGNLIVPSGTDDRVRIYQGPALCGKVKGSFADPYGEPSDAASADAATGTIIVGNIVTSGTDKVGNIAICTLKKGCTQELTSTSITYYGGGVALAKNGDCWIASENNPSFSAATLTYFKHCEGAGTAALGWKNASYGGLIIDKKGNLISIDWDTPALWVYRGCAPTCRVVGGPFTLEGDSFYGNLSKSGKELALGDAQYGQVDVYRYRPKKLTYKYSFNKGLNQSYDVEAAGFAPSL
jgi:WD40 repeat protein